MTHGCEPTPFLFSWQQESTGEKGTGTRLASLTPPSTRYLIEAKTLIILGVISVLSVRALPHFIWPAVKYGHMISLNSNPPGQTPLKVPRLDSLLHRLQHAKDADGQPIPLLDELLFLLDDPPPGTTDRWQLGADLCASHGIATSRMSVWRLYRAQILQWRRDQNPAPPAPPPSPEETALLHEQARHLAAQRALEALNDPRLSTGHLIGLIKNDNHRQQIQLARDQFNDRLLVRSRAEERERFQSMDDRIRDEHLFEAQMVSYRNFFKTLLAIPPHTTP